MTNDVNNLVDCGIYLLKARNLTCGVYHQGKFYGFRSKHGDTFIDYEWSISNGNSAEGTAQAIQQLGQVHLSDACFVQGEEQKQLWAVLEAIDGIADELWKDWYEEYTKNSKYKIDRVQAHVLKMADTIVESSFPMLSECSDNMEVEQVIEYIATRAREYVAQHYTP